MWGGGESWGELEKKKARTHPVTFPGSRPWAKVHTATPSWLAQGPTASTLKGHRGRAATSKVRGFRQGRLPLHCPSLLGGRLHSEEALYRHRLAQPCSAPAASTLGAHQL